MNKIVRLFLLSLGGILLLATPALAQGEGQGGPSMWFEFSNYFGVAFTVLGASYGISKLASAAYEGMSRQPEVAGNIQTAMIIAAALIEGFTFFALYICMS